MSKTNIAPIQEPANAEPRLSISVDVINKILSQFGSMPYVQVAQIINEIQEDVKPIEGQGDDK